jgi:predicted DNA-binding protein (MmcQ/YjbR family)
MPATKKSKPTTKILPPPEEMTAEEEAFVERLRSLCMSYPEANEKRSHGEPTWFAGKGKVFAMLDNHHHGAERLAVWLPQPFGVQEALTQAEPERYFTPPYVGVKGWLGVVLDADSDWDEIKRLLREAYLLIATAKLRAKVL